MIRHALWLYHECPEHYADVHAPTGREAYVLTGYEINDEVAREILKRFQDLEIREYYREGMKIYVMMKHDQEEA